MFRLVANSHDRIYGLPASVIFRPEAVSARHLRYLLVAELIPAGRPMTIADLIGALTGHGFVIGPKTGVSTAR